MVQHGEHAAHEADLPRLWGRREVEAVLKMGDG